MLVLWDVDHTLKTIVTYQVSENYGPSAKSRTWGFFLFGPQPKAHFSFD